MSRRCLGSRASVCIADAPGDECLSDESSLPSSFLLDCFAELDVIWYGRSLRLAWVSCPGYVTSQLPAHLQPTGFLGGAVCRDGPDAVRVLLSSSQNASGYQHLSSYQIQSTALWGLLWGKLTLSQPDPKQSPCLIPYHLHHPQVPCNLVYLYIF